jgi:hypothetical protein
MELLLMILLRGKLVENRPLDIARDNWREITRGAYAAVGQYWVDNYLMGHFEPGAGVKYRYKFRTRAYNRRKDLKRSQGKPMQRGNAPVIAGSDTPNVLTGYMKREMTRSVVVRGFPTRATVYMYGPQYLSMRYRFKNQPNKPAEITTVRGDEREKLAQVLRAEVLKRINAYRGQKVTE